MIALEPGEAGAFMEPARVEFAQMDDERDPGFAFHTGQPSQLRGQRGIIEVGGCRMFMPNGSMRGCQDGSDCIELIIHKQRNGQIERVRLPRTDHGWQYC